MRRFATGLLWALALGSACGDRGRSDFACGAIYLAGATMLLDEFTRPRTTLSAPPSGLPTMLPVRIAAGPVYRGLVGYLGDSAIVVGVEGAIPPGTDPGFGVLAVGLDSRARGVLLYTGAPVAGAPRLGSVVIGDRPIPLIGIRTDITGLEDPNCPFFPPEMGRP